LFTAERRSVASWAVLSHDLSVVLSYFLCYYSIKKEKKSKKKEDKQNRRRICWEYNLHIGIPYIWDVFGGAFGGYFFFGFVFSSLSRGKGEAEMREDRSTPDLMSN